MRIVVYMFFDAERQSLLFQHHTECDVERFVFVGEVRVVSVFHKTACVGLVQIDVDVIFHKIVVQVVQHKEFTRHIDHRAYFAFFGQER